MIEVVGVRFKQSGKIYYFDPKDLPIQLGDDLIVETARGIEYGHCVISKKTVEEESLGTELKPVIRIADEADKFIHKENLKKAVDALDICEEKIKDHGLAMKLVDCEYTFDNNKVIFYFTADHRVDFRELVKDLAYIFKIRIELRQIGVRDQAKILGGIGPCGQSCCCKRFLCDFNPVSIKMAKEQSLSLNPSKISGLCGRLMCCLRYEQDGYEEKLKRMPQYGDYGKTEDGEGPVVETNTLMETVKMRIQLTDGTEEIMEYSVDDVEFMEG
ncbi:MAG: stage 0 sporulation family protein [Tissierellia bacterium]|nr:stage 0 sporulation family protein [Tissierellia bacterium]